MAATAGYRALVQLGSGSPITITGLKTADLTVSGDVYDITDLNSNQWKKKLGGLADYSIKLGGNFDLSDAQQTALQNAAIVTPGTPVTWAILPQGTGTPKYSGTALVKSMGVKFDVKSEEQVTFDLEGSGALVYA